MFNSRLFFPVKNFNGKSMKQLSEEEWMRE